MYSKDLLIIIPLISNFLVYGASFAHIHNPTNISFSGTYNPSDCNAQPQCNMMNQGEIGQVSEEMQPTQVNQPCVQPEPSQPAQQGGQEQGGQGQEGQGQEGQGQEGQGNGLNQAGTKVVVQQNVNLNNQHKYPYSGFSYPNPYILCNPLTHFGCHRSFF